MNDLVGRLRAYQAHDATADALLGEAAEAYERLLALWANQTMRMVAATDEIERLRDQLAVAERVVEAARHILDRNLTIFRVTTGIYDALAAYDAHTKDQP